MVVMNKRNRFALLILFFRSLFGAYIQIFDFKNLLMVSIHKFQAPNLNPECGLKLLKKG